MIVRAAALQEDGWTYGEWRQFVAYLDNGQAVCCRHARWPFYAFLSGLLLLATIAVATWANHTQGVPLYWGRVYWAAVLAFALTGPQLLFSLTGWRCVARVGPYMDREPDGTYRRNFFGDA